MVDSLNSLLKQGLIEVYQQGNELLYRKGSFRREESLKLNPEESLVYQCIRNSSDKGIWTKDIKTKTGLHQTILNKALKNLESHKLVKTFKNHKNPTRKTYILYDLSPSSEASMSLWLENCELDEEFIIEITNLCLKFVQSKSPQPVKLKDIFNFIGSTEVIKVRFSASDIVMLANRLIFDGKIGLVSNENKLVPFVPLRSANIDDYHVLSCLFKPMASSLASTPCGNCPVESFCNDKMFITPEECSYIDIWSTF